jgi:membrane-bound serine protease (ClpP class)
MSNQGYAEPTRPLDIVKKIGEQIQDAQSPKKVKESDSINMTFDPSLYIGPTLKPLPNLEGDQVLVIPIHGTIDRGLPPFIERQFTENPNADVIIFDVDTFGGRVDAATEIRDLILKESRPTIAYVHRRAISAGALISFSTDYLVFSEGGTMGAATPIQMNGGEAKAVGEKMVSYFRSEMRSTAEQNGWDGNLAEAMVDRDKEIKGVSPKGKLLTVTTKQAQALKMMNAFHPTLDSLIEELNLKNAQIIHAETNWAEKNSSFFYRSNSEWSFDVYWNVRNYG